MITNVKGMKKDRKRKIFQKSTKVLFNGHKWTKNNMSEVTVTVLRIF